MRQGAVGHVRVVERDGRTLVEKRMSDPARHDTELRALRALAGSGLPVPEVVASAPGSILMSRMPGDRLDAASPDERLRALRASGGLLRRLHETPPPAGLAPAPDDELIVQRYRAAGGPAIALAVPAPHPPAFCHGDWTDANLLAVDGEVSAVVDWEAAHVGDPVRELARAAWGAARKDPRSFGALVDGYGADRAAAVAWVAIHAAELWLWFAQAGPPEYLAELSAELQAWPSGTPPFA